MPDRRAPDPAALRGLLERVEAASGPDREVDARLQHLLAPDHTVLLDHGVAFGPGEKRPARFGPLSEFPIDGWEDYDGIAVAIGAQPYTGSIDAAVGLVERRLPGAVWHVMTDYGGLNRAKIGPTGKPSASVYNCEERPLFQIADATTPPLALCAALLRALLAHPAPEDRPDAP